MSDEGPSHDELRRRLDRLASHAPEPASGRDATVSRARRRARIGMAAVSAGVVAFSIAAVVAVGAIRDLDRGGRPIGPAPTGTVEPAPSDSAPPAVRAEGQIAYWSDRSPPGGQAHLMVIEANGGASGDVGDLSISTSRLSWSPDAQQLVFDHGTGSGAGQLEVIAAGGGTPSPIFSVEDPQSPDWSPTGELVVFHTDSGAMFTVPASGGTSGTPIRRYGPRSFLEGLDPTWSPDGDRIAFVDDRSGDVGVVRVAGTSEPEYLEVDGRAESLDWGTGGLVVSVFQRGAGASLFRIDPNGETAPEALPDPDGEEFDPSLSPDGRFVAFTSNVGDQSDVYVMEIATGKVERLTNDARFDFSPAWRPAS